MATLAVYKYPYSDITPQIQAVIHLINLPEKNDNTLLIRLDLYKNLSGTSDALTSYIFIIPKRWNMIKILSPRHIM